MLSTPDILGISQAEQQHLHGQWSTYQRVLTRLQQEGFAPLPIPTHTCPGYLDPETLSSYDSKTILRTYADYKAWYDFWAQRLMYTEMILIETTNEMAAIKRLAKKKLRNLGNKKPSNDEINDEVHDEPRYVALLQQEQENDQLKKAYVEETERLEGAYKVVSRVITMRGQDLEGGRRGGNIGSDGVGRDF